MDEIKSKFETAFTYSGKAASEIAKLGDYFQFTVEEDNTNIYNIPITECLEYFGLVSKMSNLHNELYQFMKKWNLST